jgi:hypothetical protein
MATVTMSDQALLLEPMPVTDEKPVHCVFMHSGVIDGHDAEPS